MTPLRFGGYAALFDRVDRAGDVFRAGAFADAGPVPLLAHHRGRAVGTLRSVGGDARGLRVAGEVTDAATAEAVRAGALPGLSVGFRALASRQSARREITRAQLVEVSLVAMPMQPGARIELFNEGD